MNKNVRMRECKRHTSRCVESTRCDALSPGGERVPTLAGGVPTLDGKGTYPGWGISTMDGGYIPWTGGT